MADSNETSTTTTSSSGQQVSGTEERCALELRAETINLVAVKRAERRGVSDRLEIGKESASDTATGHEEVNVEGNYRLEGRDIETSASIVKRTFRGRLNLRLYSDTLMLSGAVSETFVGVVTSGAGMCDVLGAAGGLRVTTSGDFRLINGLAGMEEKPGTSINDKLLLEIAATSFQREYGVASYKAAFASYSGEKLLSMEAGTWSMLKASLGFRQQIKGQAKLKSGRTAMRPNPSMAPAADPGLSAAVRFGLLTGTGRGIKRTTSLINIDSMAKTAANAADFPPPPVRSPSVDVFANHRVFLPDEIAPGAGEPIPLPINFAARLESLNQPPPVTTIYPIYTSPPASTLQLPESGNSSYLNQLSVSDQVSESLFTTADNGSNSHRLSSASETELIGYGDDVLGSPPANPPPSIVSDMGGIPPGAGDKPGNLANRDLTLPISADATLALKNFASKTGLTHPTLPSTSILRRNRGQSASLPSIPDGLFLEPSQLKAGSEAEQKNTKIFRRHSSAMQYDARDSISPRPRLMKEETDWASPRISRSENETYKLVNPSTTALNKSDSIEDLEQISDSRRSSIVSPDTEISGQQIIQNNDDQKFKLENVANNDSQKTELLNSEDTYEEITSIPIKLEKKEITPELLPPLENLDTKNKLPLNARDPSKLSDTDSYSAIDQARISSDLLHESQGTESSISDIFNTSVETVEQTPHVEIPLKTEATVPVRDELLESSINNQQKIVNNLFNNRESYTALLGDDPNFPIGSDNYHLVKQIYASESAPSVMKPKSTFPETSQEFMLPENLNLDAFNSIPRTPSLQLSATQNGSRPFGNSRISVLRNENSSITESLSSNSINNAPPLVRQTNESNKTLVGPNPTFDGNKSAHNLKNEPKTKGNPKNKSLPNLKSQNVKNTKTSDKVLPGVKSVPRIDGDRTKQIYLESIETTFNKKGSLDSFEQKLETAKQNYKNAKSKKTETDLATKQKALEDFKVQEKMKGFVVKIAGGVDYTNSRQYDELVRKQRDKFIKNDVDYKSTKKSNPRITDTELDNQMNHYKNLLLKRAQDAAKSEMSKLANKPAVPSSTAKAGLLSSESPGELTKIDVNSSPISSQNVNTDPVSKSDNGLPIGKRTKHVGEAGSPKLPEVEFENKEVLLEDTLPASLATDSSKSQSTPLVLDSKTDSRAGVNLENKPLADANLSSASKDLEDGLLNSENVLPKSKSKIIKQADKKSIEQSASATTNSAKASTESKPLSHKKPPQLTSATKSASKMDWIENQLYELKTAQEHVFIRYPLNEEMSVIDNLNRTRKLEEIEQEKNFLKLLQTGISEKDGGKYLADLRNKLISEGGYSSNQLAIFFDKLLKDFDAYLYSRSGNEVYLNLKFEVKNPKIPPSIKLNPTTSSDKSKFATLTSPFKKILNKHRSSSVLTSTNIETSPIPHSISKGTNNGLPTGKGIEQVGEAESRKLQEVESIDQKDLLEDTLPASTATDSSKSQSNPLALDSGTDSKTGVNFENKSVEEGDKIKHKYFISIDRRLERLKIERENLINLTNEKMTMSDGLERARRLEEIDPEEVLLKKLKTRLPVSEGNKYIKSVNSKLRNDGILDRDRRINLVKKLTYELLEYDGQYNKLSQNTGLNVAKSEMPSSIKSEPTTSSGKSRWADFKSRFSKVLNKYLPSKVLTPTIVETTPIPYSASNDIIDDIPIDLPTSKSIEQVAEAKSPKLPEAEYTDQKDVSEELLLDSHATDSSKAQSNPLTLGNKTGKAEASTENKPWFDPNQINDSLLTPEKVNTDLVNNPYKDLPTGKITERVDETGASKPQEAGYMDQKDVSEELLLDSHATNSSKVQINPPASRSEQLISEIDGKAKLSTENKPLLDLKPQEAEDEVLSGVAQGPQTLSDRTKQIYLESIEKKFNTDHDSLDNLKQELETAKQNHKASETRKSGNTLATKQKALEDFKVQEKMKGYVIKITGEVDYTNSKQYDELVRKQRDKFIKNDVDYKSTKKSNPRITDAELDNQMKYYKNLLLKRAQDVAKSEMSKLANKPAVPSSTAKAGLLSSESPGELTKIDVNSSPISSQNVNTDPVSKSDNGLPTGKITERVDETGASKPQEAGYMDQKDVSEELLLDSHATNSSKVQINPPASRSEQLISEIDGKAKLSTENKPLLDLKPQEAEDEVLSGVAQGPQTLSDRTKQIYLESIEKKFNTDHDSLDNLKQELETAKQNHKASETRKSGNTLATKQKALEDFKVQEKMKGYVIKITGEVDYTNSKQYDELVRKQRDKFIKNDVDYKSTKKSNPRITDAELDNQMKYYKNLLLKRAQDVAKSEMSKLANKPAVPSSTAKAGLLSSESPGELTKIDVNSSPISSQNVNTDPVSKSDNGLPTGKITERVDETGASKPQEAGYMDQKDVSEELLLDSHATNSSKVQINPPASRSEQLISEIDGKAKLSTENKPLLDLKPQEAEDEVLSGVAQGPQTLSDRTKQIYLESIEKKFNTDHDSLDNLKQELETAKQNHKASETRKSGNTLATKQKALEDFKVQEKMKGYVIKITGEVDYTNSKQYDELVRKQRDKFIKNDVDYKSTKKSNPRITDAELDNQMKYYKNLLLKRAQDVAKSEMSKLANKPAVPSSTAKAGLLSSESPGELINANSLPISRQNVNTDPVNKLEHSLPTGKITEQADGAVLQTVADRMKQIVIESLQNELNQSIKSLDDHLNEIKISRGRDNVNSNTKNSIDLTAKENALPAFDDKVKIQEEILEIAKLVDYTQGDKFANPVKKAIKEFLQNSHEYKNISQPKIKGNALYEQMFKYNDLLTKAHNAAKSEMLQLTKPKVKTLPTSPPTSPSTSPPTSPSMSKKMLFNRGSRSLTPTVVLTTPSPRNSLNLDILVEAEDVVEITKQEFFRLMRNDFNQQYQKDLAIHKKEIENIRAQHNEINNSELNIENEHKIEQAFEAKNKINKDALTMLDNVPYEINQFNMQLRGEIIKFTKNSSYEVKENASKLKELQDQIYSLKTRFLDQAHETAKAILSDLPERLDEGPLVAPDKMLPKKILLTESKPSRSNTLQITAEKTRQIFISKIQKEVNPRYENGYPNSLQSLRTAEFEYANDKSNSNLFKVHKKHLIMELEKANYKIAQHALSALGNMDYTDFSKFEDLADKQISKLARGEFRDVKSSNELQKIRDKMFEYKKLFLEKAHQEVVAPKAKYSMDDEMLMLQDPTVIERLIMEDDISSVFKIPEKK